MKTTHRRFIICLFLGVVILAASLLSLQATPLNSISTITGATTGDQFGFSVSWYGNLNGDTDNDLVIGAPYNNSTDGSKPECGAVYIFFGLVPSSPSASNANVTIYGATAGDHFGWGLAGGDVNGDGMKDIIIGAPDNSSQRGSVYIFYGRATAAWAGINNANQANVTITGESSGDKFGYSVASGENVDGSLYEDVVVGAMQLPTNIFYDDFESGVGKWTVSGAQWGLDSTKYHSPTNSMWSSKNGNYADNIYIVTTANIDTSKSLNPALSFWHRYQTDPVATGYDIFRVQVSTDDFATVTTLVNFDSTTIIDWAERSYSLEKFKSATLKIRFWIDADAADFGEGWHIDDVKIYDKNLTGATYLFYADGSIPTTASTSDVKLKGNDYGELFGASVSLADVDNDGKSDIVIGAPGYDNNRGKTHIYYGGKLAQTTIFSENFNDQNANGWGIDPPIAFVSGGPSGTGYYLDLKYSATDKTSSIVKEFNMKNVTNATLTFWWNSAGLDSGEYVWYQIYDGVWHPAVTAVPTAWTKVTVDLTPYNMNELFDIRFGVKCGATNEHGYLDDIFINATVSAVEVGETQGSKFGFSVSNSRDVNEDSITDIVIGAPGFSSDKGRSYLYYGLVTYLPGVTTNKWFVDVSVESGKAQAQSFTAPKDGILLGVELGGIDAGADSVSMSISINSTSGGLPSGAISSVESVDFAPDPGSWKMITFSTPPTLVGGEKYWIVATSTDSSGNGYYWFSDDGNPYGGGGTSTNTGTGWSAESTTTDLVFILHYQPNVTLTGSQLGDQFGYSVSGAGDLNKDGYNDTIIGAPYNESAKGAVYVFNGSANIPSTISALDANYTAYGENANDRFGFSVSAASDINGDTYPDAIVGAPGYSSNKGRAYVYTTQPIGVVDQKPSSQASVPGDYWKISTPFNISWNASDDNGLTNITLWYRYSMDNSSWSGWISYAKKDVSGTYADNSTNGNFSFTASNGDGYYQFYTIANDTKPQSEDPPATYDACAGVDTTKPSSAVLPISPYWQTSATFTITANASDYNATGGESGVKNITLYYRYSTDNSSWGSWTYSSTNSTLTFTDPYNCTASFTFNSPDGDGYYEFYSIAADNATNEELAPTEKDALAGVDTTPPGNWNNPEIKGNSSATWVSKESWVNETTVDCKLGAGDTLSGVNLSSIEYGYSTNDGDTWTWASAGWSGSETSGVMYAWGVAFGMESSQSSGYPLRIRFRLKDKAGNVNDYNVWQVKIDITAPSKPLDITAKPSYWTNVNNFNISWTNPADVSGIVGAYYKIGSAPTNNTDGTYVSGANISWIDGIIVPDNGTWTIYVWLRDAANNVNYANNNSTTVYYDAIPPNNPTSCTTPGVQNNTWQNSTNDTNFTWSGASDPPAPDGTFSGVSGYYYYWGKDAEGIGADANYTTIPAFDPAPIPNEGVYYLRVKTRDNASNNASWITLFVFKYDNSTPGYWQNFYPPTGWVNTTTVNCSIQVRDFYKSIGNASGLNVSSAYFNYSTDGGTVWSGWLKANCTGSNGTNDFQTVWAWVTFVDGINKNKIKFKISDMIGQMNISEIYSVDVDTTPPTSFVDSISPYWHNTTLTITATANDTLSGVKNITLYYYNSTNNDTFDGPWLFSTNETPTKVGNNWTASWEFNFSLAKGEGYYRFYSLAIDNASNQESLELYAKNNTFSGTVENSTNIQGTPDDKYASLSSETSWIRGGNYSVATGTIVKVEIAWRYYVLPEFTNDKINLRYLVNGVYGATALGAFTPTSTTPVINYVDVTADRTWTWSDIALLEVHADYTVTGGVDGTLNIDALWIRVTAIDTICGYDSTPPSNPMPPATESNGAQNNTWQNTVKSPAFEWPWPSDNLAGVDGFYWYFGPSDTGTSTSYVTTNSTSVGTWENGTYYFRIMTRDKAGNNNTSWITMFVFKHDAALPTITYNYPSAGGATSWYNGDPGNVIDIDFGWVANSPLDYAQYRIGAGSWIDIFTADQASDYTANWNVAWASLTDGNNEISIRVADIAGNILTHTYVSGASGFLFRKDTVAPANPTNNNTNPEINIWTNDNTIYVEWWGASDDHSGIAGYYYAWTQDSTTIPTASDNYTTTTSNLSSPLADGIWYLHIRAVDNASNLASGAYHVGAFKIDTTPPSSTIETPLNDATIDTTPIWINGTCSDQAQLSGINKVEINITYKENGTVVKAWINTNLAANYSWWDYQFYPPSEGNYTIKVRAVDNASNVGAVVQINITYSKAAPTITKVIFYITENNDTYTKYPNLTLNLSIEVSGATSVKVRFRNEYYEWHAWLDYNLSSETYLSGKYNHYSWVLSKNDGTKIVYVEINASSVKGYTLANSNDDIILDSLKPSISNLIPLDGSLVRNRTVNITAIVNDTHIDWSSMTVRIDGNATNRWQNTNKTPVLEGWKIWVVWNFSTDGDYHRVEIVVKDYANNTAVKEWSFVVDSTPVTPGDIRFSHYHAREGQNITIYVTIYKNETTPGEVEFTVIIRNHAGDSLAIYNATTGELIPNGKFIIGKGTFITVKAYDIIVEKGDKTTDVTGRKYLAATYTVIVNNSTASPEKEIERQTAIFPIVYLEPPPAPVPSFEITFVAVLGASLLIALISTLRKRKK